MYVAFEGIDCVGKSTQISLLKSVFKEAIFTMEPGGTKLGEHLRKLLLDREINFEKRSELLLFLADRSEHYEKILKANKNKLIISDRSFVSGMAYAKDFKNEELFWLNNFALNGFFPQKIVFLKADKMLIEQRLSLKKLDFIEKNGANYFLDIQERLESVLEFLKERISLEILSLNANESKENLHKIIKEFIDD